MKVHDRPWVLAKRKVEKGLSMLRHVDHLIDLFRAYRDGAGAAVTFDVRGVTGRDPVSFEQFVRDHADALRAGPMTTQSPSG